MDHKLLSEKIFTNTNDYDNPKEVSAEVIKESEDVLPIASVSKNFMGLTTVLFLYANENSYLLNSNGGVRSKIAPEDLTVLDILKNRKAQLEGLDVRTKPQQQKLESVEKWLDFAERNDIFAKTTIKSLLNHTSAMVDKKLAELGKTENQTISLVEPEDGVELDKRGYSIPVEKFIDLLSQDGGFNENNLGIYSYNNAAFGLAGEIMSLMTDKETFFEETRDRVLKPLGLGNSIMPYYEVPLDKRENFKGQIDYAKDNMTFSNDKSGYAASCYGSDCTLAAGALTATMGALQKYGEELAKFYTDDPESKLKIDGDKKPSEIFEAFAVDRKKELYSLGMYRKNEGNKMHFYHIGTLNPHHTTFDMYVSPDKTVKTEINHYKHDTPIAFIGTTKELLGMYRKSKGVKGDENFSDEFKAKLEELKTQPSEGKIKVANDFRGVAGALYGVLITSDKKTQELKVKNTFEDLAKNEHPLAKLFVKEFERVSGKSCQDEKEKGGVGRE